MSRLVVFVKTKELDCTLVPKFSTKDISTIQIEKQNIMLCSAYLDITTEAWPKILDDLADHCNDNNISLVLGADTNAHSTLWNCDSTNARGDIAEQAIIQNQLFIHNEGNEVTFNGGVGSSIIDVTMSNDPILVSDWEVSAEVTHSDHNVVKFSLGRVKKDEQVLKRNINRVNWSDVADDLLKVTPEPRTFWSKASLDEACSNLTKALQDSLDTHAPKIPPAKRHNYWWNDDCVKSKREMRAAERKMRNHRTPQSVAAEQEARKAYNKVIYKAKQQAWRKFISEIDSMPEMARVNKIMKLSNGPTHELGLVKDDNGDLAETKQESLGLMLKEHFPLSTDWEEEDKSDETEVEVEKQEWLTVARFNTAVKSFKKGKSPGIDEFRAECLEKLRPATKEHIIELFNASIALGYVPWEWRKVNVLFMPKAGKDDYTNRRSFRPISLMSVIFKTMERLVLWRLEETTLQHAPIHHHQFGFKKGKSTENAISKVVNYVEKGINSGKYVLGVFMDIAGAFDNVNLESIIREMQERNVPDKIVNWYKHFLHNRKVTSELGTASAAVKPKKGTPQGGVLSAIIAWNLVFDQFLNNYDGPDHRGILSIAFADDGTLLITGIDVQTMYARMQNAINAATDWARENGLEFCPKKTNAVLFTRRNKPVRNKPNLKMNGQRVPNVNSVTLLGVTINSRMTWNEHIEKKIKACKKSLMQLRPILGKAWSPKPEYTEWLYKSVILPMLTYGSIVWAKATETQSIQNKLNKLQRLGLLSIANVRRSTPTAALELIYNVAPLHLQIREKAVNAYLRMPDMHEEGEWVPNCPSKLGHLRYLNRIVDSIGIDSEEESDEMAHHRNWDQTYEVEIADEPCMELGTRVYTDGSLYKEKSGAGSYIEIDSEPIITISERLQNCTVFQAELRAIKAACDYLNKVKNYKLLGEVNFYVDNQAALKALQASTITSHLVLETKLALEELGNARMIKLNWIKAHVGHPGNELADQAAKAGSQSSRFPKDVNIGQAKAKAKQIIRTARDKAWKDEWIDRTDCRQTKCFIEGPNPAIWRSLKHKKQKCVSNAIRFLTGHAFMNRQNTIVALGKEAALQSDEINCRLCEEGEETPIHLISECPCISWLRQEKLQTWNVDLPLAWSANLLDFIQSSTIRQLETSDET